MRRVGPGRLTLAAACLVWLLFLVSTLGGVWMILTGRMTADPSVMAVVGFAPGRERVAEISCWMGVAVCAAFTVYFAWRTFYLGTGHLLYDEEMVVFVFSRRERRSLRWRDLASYGVTVRDLGEIEPPVIPLLWGFFFQFPDGKRFPVRRMYQGYGDLGALLERKGLLAARR